MWYLILGLITAIYLVVNLVLPSGGEIESYIIRPLLWIGLAILTYLFSQKEGLSILQFRKVRRWFIGNSPWQTGVLLGGFHVAMLILIGLFAGFGKSPYAFTPIAILRNAFFISSLLIGMEISRAYLIKTGTRSRKYGTFFLGLITLFFVLISINLAVYQNLDIAEPAAALEFLGRTFITALAMNLLASYLSYLGGAYASMGYMGVLLFFEWFSPILPNPHWTILALVGTIAPAVGFVVLQNSLDTEDSKGRTKKRRQQNTDYSWTAIAVFGVIIVFFSFGYLGVNPTVIYSGSMSPTYEVGDIVLIEDTSFSEIQEGDVIQFVRDNVTMIHRVVDAYSEDDQSVFITQGDANDHPDSNPVLAPYVTGKAVFTIPKIGWIQIAVKNLFYSIGIPI